MSATVVETHEMDLLLHKLAILEEKSGPEILSDEARLLTVDMAKLVPPTGKGDANQSENWAEQKRHGIGRTSKEVNRAWKPASGFAEFLKKGKHARAAKYLQKYINSGRTSAVAWMANSFRLHPREVAVQATESAHNALRDDSTGRLRKGVKPALVLRSNSIKQLLKTKVDKVGTAKGGFAEAAAGLSATIPQWLKGHARSRGMLNKQLTGPVKSITIGNLTDFAQKLGARKRVVETALKLRKLKMEARIRYKLLKPKHLL